MISKRTTYILCALLNLTFATQTMHAGLWQTICSPFASMAKYIQQRPLISAAAALGTLAISGGVYWWYKARVLKQRELHQRELRAKEDLDLRNMPIVWLKETREKFDRDIAHFQNTKNLISMRENVDRDVFYEQLSAFLPQVRQALQPEQRTELDALRFGQIAQGSQEYWNACGRLSSALDRYIDDTTIQKAKLISQLEHCSAAATRTLQIMRQAQHQRS